MNIEVFSVGGKFSADWQNNGISEDSLWLEFALLVGVHSVEFGKVYIDSEISDCNAEDLKSGVHRLQIFERSCVVLGLRQISKIDDFDLN